MSGSTLQERVLEGIDADELTAMAVDLINIPSPPGEEGAIVTMS